MGRVARKAGLAVAIVSALLVSASPCSAESLSSQIVTIFGKNGITTVTPSHTAHFGSESLQLFGVLVQQLSSQASDFPAPATAPGLTFRYDPKLEVFEPAEENFTAPFVDEPRTQGKGRFEIGFTYEYLDFDSFDGKDLDHLSFRGLKHNDCCGGKSGPAGSSPGDPAFENDTADVFYEQFTLRSNVFAFSGTYGLTDAWDFNVLIPVVFTQLDLVARAELHNTSNLVTHEFDPFGATKKRSEVNDDHLGVGDLLLRTKYRFLEAGDFLMAGAVSVIVPTGSEENFQGAGDVQVAPGISLLQTFGRLDFHLASAVQVDADNTDRSRVRYGAGLTYQHLPRELALFFDVIGSSNIEKQSATVSVPEFDNESGREVQVSSKKFTQKSRTDIVDIAPGFKFALAKNAVAFFQCFIPANSDGLRTSFTPTGGVEVSF